MRDVDNVLNTRELARMIRQANLRMSAIHAEEESPKLRKSHDNPAVTELYRDFPGKPLGHKSHELLHTRYAQKERR